MITEDHRPGREVSPGEARTRGRAWTLLLLCLCAPFVLLSLSFLLFPPPAPKPYSLVLTDRNGEFLHAFLAEDGVWRLRTDPEEIPLKLRRILIEKEDRWFPYHPGVNPLSVIRAALQNLRSRKVVSGASTITMQIARMLEPKERTYWNKMLEMLRAFQLEWKYSKRELLELYLSLVPLGGNIEGLKSAALLYHRTPPDRLNLAQLLDLTLIPSDPNGLEPGRNGERLFALRTHLAHRWLEAGFLSKEDSEVIWRTPAAAERRPLWNGAPHFSLRVKETPRIASEVRTSLDLRIQRIAETLLSEHLRPWKQRGVVGGAVLVVENRGRQVAAYVGSENFYDVSACGQVDGVRAIRSPGSTLKPLLYAQEMERGDLTPKTRLLDVPYDAEGFQADNYDGSFSGMVPADEALQRSLNVPMVRLLKRRGPSVFLDFLARLGVVSIQSQRGELGLSLILGGCGVTLEELVGAYAAFPAGGIWQELSLLTGKGEVRSERVFSAATAYMVTDILTGLERPDLPTNFESSLSLPAVAFKTGTSYGRRDAWAIGYTGEYTIGVWIGNPDNSGNPDLVGGKVAAPLLVDLLNSISTKHRKTILPLPETIGVRTVCALSGSVPGPRCDHLITDLYAEGQTNNTPCTVCQEFLVSEDGRTSYCPSCLGTHTYLVKTFRSFPPELLHFWESTGRRFTVAPPHNRSCTRVFAGTGPTIISPSERTIYYLVSRRQSLAFIASSGVEVSRHAWYLDDRFLETSRPGEKLFVQVEPGNHVIACVDDHGRSSAVRITVKSAM